MAGPSLELDCKSADVLICPDYDGSDPTSRTGGHQRCTGCLWAWLMMMKDTCVPGCCMTSTTMCQSMESHQAQE